MPIFTGPVISAMIGGGASLLGGIAGDLFSSNSAAQTNTTNEQIAQMNNQFNAQQAQLNRNFQADQSNTAMQRRVQDLKAAGLNPLLAVPQGAQAMTGATASSAGLPSVQNPGASFANLGSVVGNAASSASDAYLKTTQAKNIDMDTMLKSAKLPYAGQQAQQETQNLRTIGQDISSARFLKDAQFDNTVEDTRRLMQNNEFQLEVWNNLVKMQEYETRAKALGLPSLAQDADFMNGPWGKFVPLLQKLIVPGSQALGNVTGSLKDIISSILQFFPTTNLATSAWKAIGPGGGVTRGSSTSGSISGKFLGAQPVNP